MVGSGGSSGQKIFQLFFGKDLTRVWGCVKMVLGQKFESGLKSLAKNLLVAFLAYSESYRNYS